MELSDKMAGYKTTRETTYTDTMFDGTSIVGWCFEQSEYRKHFDSLVGDTLAWYLEYDDKLLDGKSVD